MKPVPAGVLLRGIDTETGAPHVTASMTATIRPRLRSDPAGCTSGASTGHASADGAVPNVGEAPARAAWRRGYACAIASEC